MSYQWIRMRIAEEQERRGRENVVRARLPLAMQELAGAIEACVSDFNQAFEDQAADVASAANRIQISIRQRRSGSWTERASVLVAIDPELPGFKVVNGGDAIGVEVGMLGGDKMFYKSGERYLAVEDLTKLVLDRVMFPGMED